MCNDSFALTTRSLVEVVCTTSEGYLASSQQAQVIDNNSLCFIAGVLNRGLILPILGVNLMMLKLQHFAFFCSASE